MSRIFNGFMLSACTAALLVGNPASAQTVTAMAPVSTGKAAVAAPGEAALQQGAQLLQQGRATEAVATLRPLVNSQNVTTRAQSRYLLALALDGTGNPAEGLRALEGTLTDDTPLGKAVGALRGQLLLQAAELSLMEGASDRTAQYLRDYERLSIQPDKARFQRLTDALNPPADRASRPPLRVGVILPQTGPLGAAGMDILRGLQLGLPEYTAAGRKVELVVQDAANPEAAAQAAAFLKTQNVSLVLGPLLANQVAPVRQALGSVPLLTFSSDGSALGPQIHTLNFLPDQQAAQVAKAALAQHQTRVAALVPQGAYGEATLNGLRRTLEQGGGTLVKSSFYNPQEADIGGSIRDLGKGFDALLLPASPRALPLIAAQLAYYDLDRGVQLLGTALWAEGSANSPLLAPSAGGLRGSIFAAPVPYAAFNSQFTQAFGAAPHPLAALGYDAAAVLAQLANEQARSGNAVSQILLRPEGFYAPGGYARFTANGQTERSLALQTVGQGQFEVRRPGLMLAPLALPQPLIPEPGSRSWW